MIPRLFCRHHAAVAEKTKPNAAYHYYKIIYRFVKKVKIQIIIIRI